MEKLKNRKMTYIAVLGSLIVLLLTVGGTIWMGHMASTDTEQAVSTVSLFYLDELAGQREQVVENNLQQNIENIQVAIALMTPEDLSDMEHLQAYQARMKRLDTLDKFAFVDDDGLIYTSLGTQTNIDDYAFDHTTITEPQVSILNQESAYKKVIIAVPVDIAFMGKHLRVCFMEIDMEEMLRGVSLTATTEGATFCNIYTRDGIALTNQVLGGQSAEGNLLEAVGRASFDEGYSYDAFYTTFTQGQRGVISFTYTDIRETLTYIPVQGTDWQLTYLIRESVISDRIRSISSGTVLRSLAQSILTVIVMAAMFSLIIGQSKRRNQLLLERETTRAKQEDLEQRLALQESLLKQKAQGEQQSKLITALSSDYRSVYYLELDRDHGVCYQARTDMDGFKMGEEFPYLSSVTAYCNQYILEPYREEFLRFVQPDNIRQGLKDNLIISYRYMIRANGKESYEMVKFAGVRHPEDRDDHLVHTVGACFMDVDAETRTAMAQNQALSDALATANEANKAKTVFLSNMSHEIRTPMNAIIGLDTIALNDPETPQKTREYLEKIGASAEHLLGLINDILDMSRIESGRMVLKNEEFSFSKLLEHINTMFSGQCTEKGLEYQCHINGQVDDYYIGDNMKLRQVFINILGNAVKFTPAGGAITFTAERVAQFDGKSTLRFVIQDTGIGMSKAFLPHIFDTFAQEDSSATNKYGSSGLGMAITKNIVEMMNGHIQVESEKGKGTTFTVTVTLLDDPRSAEEIDDREIRPHEMCVLVVDDDPVACEHAKLVLEKAGIAAEIAASGAEAVDMVTLRHARRTPYNLILVDWQMPEMDGVEATRRIRKIVGNESAIIILTAYRWDDVLEEALAAGVDSFIPKPLFAATVLEEFKDALKRKGLTANRQQKKADLKGRRVLLAEDVAVNAEIMMMVLQMREIQADLAENGRIAVDAFAAHPAGYYDAILMDMRMPEMDGLQATQTIRAMDRPDAKSIPIIALTANAFDEDVQRSLQAGLNAHLTKPVQPENLFETLENLIQP